MDMCYDGALVMPSSYAMMDEEEMSYVEGGWSMDQMLQNLFGLTACFSLGYVGNALINFTKANMGMGLGQFIVEMGSTAWHFVKCLPWQLQVLTGFSIAAVVYSLGEFDIF